MDMIRLSDYVKIIAGSAVVAVMVIALGGCGNTVKGIGQDIVKMGEKISEEKKTKPAEIEIIDGPNPKVFFEPKTTKKGTNL